MSLILNIIFLYANAYQNVMYLKYVDMLMVPSNTHNADSCCLVCRTMQGLNGCRSGPPGSPSATRKGSKGIDASNSSICKSTRALLALKKLGFETVRHSSSSEARDQKLLAGMSPQLQTEVAITLPPGWWCSWCQTMESVIVRAGGRATKLRSLNRLKQ